MKNHHRHHRRHHHRHHHRHHRHHRHHHHIIIIIIIIIVVINVIIIVVLILPHHHHHHHHRSPSSSSSSSSVAAAAPLPYIIAVIADVAPSRLAVIVIVIAYICRWVSAHQGGQTRQIRRMTRHHHCVHHSVTIKTNTNSLMPHYLSAYGAVAFS